MPADAHLPRASAHSHRARGVARRGPVRRFAETRGLVGRLPAGYLDVRLRAEDGTPIAASYLPGPGAGGRAVLLAHGFAGNRRKPAYARLAAGLSHVGGVLTLDLRGHGGSGGACSFGDRERLDVDAGVRWLLAFGHTEVVAVGASMGATAVLHAAAHGAPLAAAVAISAPARFRDPAPPGPLRGLETLWHSDLRRGVLRIGLGITLAPPSAWGHPADPVELVRAFARPLLVVHGRDDAYFPVSDAHELVAAGGGLTTLWERPAGFGHAEDGFDDRFVRHLAAAVASTRPDTGFPGWDAARSPLP
jgi:uncharacterized protein